MDNFLKQILHAAFNVKVGASHHLQWTQFCSETYPLNHNLTKKVQYGLKAPSPGGPWVRVTVQMPAIIVQMLEQNNRRAPMLVDCNVYLTKSI